MSVISEDTFRLDRALFGDPNGWPLKPVLAWLVTEGRRITQPASLVEELARCLLAVGAPLWRMRVSLRTLHPEVVGWSYTWMRGDGSIKEFRGVHGIRDTDAYIGSPIQHVHTIGQPFRRRLDRARDHSVLFELAASGGVDYVALPLRFSDGQINVFTLATDVSQGFSEADLSKFEALAHHLTPVLEVIATRRSAEALLDTYVGHRTGRKILNRLIKRGDGEIICAALWFSDLRDFTQLTETLPKERLLAMLNAYFEFVAAAVTARGGEILRFIGDAMLIVFPVADGQQDEDFRAACRAALDAALDAFFTLAPLNHRRSRAGEPPIRFGLGLHVGEVIYGNVGAPDRLDFTVMGPAVNRTARLEDLTRDLGVSLLLSAEFAGCIDQPVRSLGFHALKGVPSPQEVFALAAHGLEETLPEVRAG